MILKMTDDYDKGYSDGKDDGRDDGYHDGLIAGEYKGFHSRDNEIYNMRYEGERLENDKWDNEHKISELESKVSQLESDKQQLEYEIRQFKRTNWG